MVRRLHETIGDGPPPALEPLAERFAPLVSSNDPEMAESREIAEDLLANQSEYVVLHGDIHHGNVLHFGSNWKVIDPKAVFGARAFDYANIFANPLPTPLDPQRFARRLVMISALSGLSKVELCQWVIAWTSLSSIWSVEDGHKAAAQSALALKDIAQIRLREMHGNQA